MIVQSQAARQGETSQHHAVSKVLIISTFLAFSSLFLMFAL